MRRSQLNARTLGAHQPKRFTIDGSADWRYLAAYIYDLVPLDEIEKWLYASPRLEQLLGFDRYAELIAFDFRQPHARHELLSLLQAAFSERRPGEVERDVAHWVASGYLHGRIGLQTTSRILAQLRADSNEWVPSEFAYIDSELDEIPSPTQYHEWEHGALTKKLAESAPRLKEFDRAARVAAEEMLRQLESNPSDA